MVSFSFLNAIDPTTIIFIVLLALLIVALLVVPMFTNKKRTKQTDELHRSLKPGDLIKTIGGIVGTIVEIRQISPVDKEMVIETGVGDNKTTMVIDMQALYMVMSRSSTIVPAKDEVEEENEEPADSAEQPVENTEPVKVAPAPEVPAPEVPAPEVPAPEVKETEKDVVAEPEVKDEAPAPEVKEEVAEQAAVEDEAAAEKKPAKAATTGKKTNTGNKKTTK